MAETSARNRIWNTLLPGRRQIKMALLVGALLAAPLASRYYDNNAPRSILVEADTGALHITLTSEMRGKTFQNALVCRSREKRDITLEGAPFGCSEKTHQLTPASAEGGSSLGESFDQALPIGTKLLIFSQPGRISLVVEDIPVRYDGTDVARLEGGGITLTGDAAKTFGSLVLTGYAVIGTAPVKSDNLSIIGGNYQISGDTVSSLRGFGRRMLKSGELRSGAHLYFRDRREKEKDPDTVLDQPAAEARLHVSVPNFETGLLRVTAISQYEPVDLTLLYYSTEPLVIRPSIIDALANDPVLVLFATLVAGIVTIFQFLLPRSRAP